MLGPEDNLTIEVALWSQTTWSDHSLLAAVAGLDLAVLGSEAAARAALERFLARHLAKAHAPELARFSLPSPLELFRVRASIPRLDLPRRLRIEVPIEVAAIGIPGSPAREDGAADRWVVVPTLDHTFFVPRGEDVAQAIVDEVVRMAAVLKPEPLDYLDLLPGRDEVLDVVHVELPFEAGGIAGAKARRALAEKKRKKEAREVLASVGRLLTEPPGFVAGPLPVGREEETRRLATLLDADTRTSVLLVGEPRVGKTELLWSVLRGEGGRERPVWATSGAQLIAGMSGLGQWQARVRTVMEAAEVLDAVLFFDDVADLFGDKSHGMDIPAAMRPFLEDARVRVVAEIRPAQLDRLEGGNVAFFSAFNRIRLEGQDREAAKAALARRRAFDAEQDPDGPRLVEEAVGPVIELTDRYFPYRPFPAKALRLYESLRALAVKAKDAEGKAPPIDAERVLEAFSLESGIPTFLLRDDEALKSAEVRAAFARRLVGQTAAVDAVVDTIQVVKASLQPAGKPLATFLFVGPTGVGKTELARALAGFLFGTEARLVRFDMSEFADPFAADRLIRGNERQEGLLTRQVRAQPFSVLLLDEIEKADASVFDLLLQVLGEGRLTDARGLTTYFHNTIIVMTSNLGAAHRRDALGFDAKAEVDASYYTEVVDKSFRPELVNRLDRIIAFSSLSRAEVEAVTRLALDKLERRRGVVDRGLVFDVSEAALARLAEDGYSEAYGARAIRRHLDQALAAPLSRVLAKAGAASRGATVCVRASGEERPRAVGRSLGRLQAGALELTLVEGQQQQARRDTQHVAQIAEMRARVSEHLALDRVEALRAQLQMVQARLNAGGEGSSKRRAKALRRQAKSAADHALLAKEHHRLRGVIEAAEGSYEALVAAEEVALMAQLTGEPTLGYLEEAAAAEQAFLRNLAYLLLADESARDEVMLIVHELSPPGGLRLWLLPFFEALEARGWTATAHVPGEAPKDGEDWPATRAWGPPRPPATIARRIPEEGPAPFASVLLRVRGPWAGVLLALEQGVHRYDKRAADGSSPAVCVLHVAMREAPAREEDWDRDQMAPPRGGTRGTHAKRKPVRRHLEHHDRLELSRAGTTIVLPLEAYWSRLEEVAVQELLAFERDPERERDGLFYGALEGGEAVSQ